MLATNQKRHYVVNLWVSVLMRREVLVKWLSTLTGRGCSLDLRPQIGNPRSFKNYEASAHEEELAKYASWEFNRTPYNMRVLRAESRLSLRCIHGNARTNGHVLLRGTARRLEGLFKRRHAQDYASLL